MSKVRAAGIFLVRNDGKILVGHPTGHPEDVWSIPKGKIDEGESTLEAAIRETMEETNIDLSDVPNPCFKELPLQVYSHKRKEITTFVVGEWMTDLEFDKFDIKCDSIVPLTSSWNAGKPELDDFKWITPDEAEEILHPTQAASIGAIKRIYSEEG
jgi:8-oxo-dGTP diphosphatase